MLFSVKFLLLKFKFETPRSSQYSESNAIPTVIRSDIMKHISYRKQRLNRIRAIIASSTLRNIS